MINHADFMAYWKLREAGGDIWVDATKIGDNYRFLEAEGLCRLEKYDTRVRVRATLHSSDTKSCRPTKSTYLKKHSGDTLHSSDTLNSSDTLHSSDMYNSVQKLLHRNVKHANSAYRSVVKGQRLPNSDTQKQLSAAAERLSPVDRGDFWKTAMELDTDGQAQFASRLARSSRRGR